MNKICGIYKITSPSKKVYIGQSININERWSKYKRLNCKEQSFLYNSLKKHTPENHIFEILCQCRPEELNNLERFYIDLYQSFNTEFGLNLRTGGNQKWQVSEETKQLISKKNKGKKKFFTEEHKQNMRHPHKKFSEQGKQNMSIAHLGNPSPNKGKKATIKTKQKMSKSRLGKSHSEEWKEKQRLSHLGKKQSADHIKHRVESLKKNKLLLINNN